MWCVALQTHVMLSLTNTFLCTEHFFSHSIISNNKMSSQIQKERSLKSFSIFFSNYYTFTWWKNTHREARLSQHSDSLSLSRMGSTGKSVMGVTNCFFNEFEPVTHRSEFTTGTRKLGMSYVLAGKPLLLFHLKDMIHPSNCLPNNCAYAQRSGFVSPGHRGSRLQYWE